MIAEHTNFSALARGQAQDWFCQQCQTQCGDALTQCAVETLVVMLERAGAHRLQLGALVGDVGRVIGIDTRGEAIALRPLFTNLTSQPELPDLRQYALNL